MLSKQEFWDAMEAVMVEHGWEIENSFTDRGYIEITTSYGCVFRSITDSHGTYYMEVATWKCVGHFSNILGPVTEVRWVEL